MKIGGYQKTSLIDFPGKVAAVVFTQGCGWRCPYCHNRSLVFPTRFQPSVPEDEIFEHLKERRAKLEGVVITGGEPTLQTGLTDFIRRVRALGLAVKLDTNGAQPNVISTLLQDNLLDYIAMDVKGPLSEYSRFAGCDVDTGPIELSIDLIKQSNIAYEFRTTLVGGLHTIEHIHELAPLMYGVRRYAVQTYRPPPHGARLHSHLSPAPDELYHITGNSLRERVDEFIVR